MQKQKEFLGYKTNAQLIRSFIHTNVCYSIDYDGLFELATQLSRIGTNINQIAKVANSLRSLSRSSSSDRWCKHHGRLTH